MQNALYVFTNINFTFVNLLCYIICKLYFYVTIYMIMYFITVFVSFESHIFIS